jgi:hypothetical protein
VFVCHKYGYIDEAGKIVIHPQFDAVKQFSEDLASVRVGPKVGYIDRAGLMVIPAEYDDAFSFEDGLAGVIVGKHWGLVDKAGRLVVPARFDELLGFSEGLSGAMIDGHWGFVDKRGSVVIPFQYKSVGSFSDNRAPVTTDAGEEQFMWITTWPARSEPVPTAASGRACPPSVGSVGAAGLSGSRAVAIDPPAQGLTAER